MNQARKPLLLVTFICIVAALIVSCFLGYFATQYAKSLTEMRVASLTDAFAVFENRLVQDEALFREQVRLAQERDATLLSFTAYAPHSDQWRVYVADGGSGEGAVVEGDMTLLAPGLAEPYKSVVLQTDGTDAADVTVVRALAPGGVPQLVLVATYEYTDTERMREFVAVFLSYGTLALFMLVMLLLVFGRRRSTEHRSSDTPTDDGQAVAPVVE